MPGPSRKGVPRGTGKVMAEATFARMWLDPSVSVNAIAAMLGVTRQAVATRANVRGLPKRSAVCQPARNRVEDEAPELGMMWRANVGLCEMAAHFGCSHTAIIKAAERMSLPKRSRSRWGKITLADYRAMQLRLAMAASARETAQAMIDSEMVDNRQAARWPARRAA